MSEYQEYNRGRKFSISIAVTPRIYNILEETAAERGTNISEAARYLIYMGHIYAREVIPKWTTKEEKK